MRNILKRKWVLFSLFLITMLACAIFYSLLLLQRDLERRSFLDFVMFEYMRPKKKTTNKWPDNIEDIINMADLNTEFGEVVIRYQRNRFIKIKPVQKCKNSYVYRVFTKDGNYTCLVTVDRDKNYCWIN